MKQTLFNIWPLLIRYDHAHMAFSALGDTEGLEFYISLCMTAGPLWIILTSLITMATTYSSVEACSSSFSCFFWQADPTAVGYSKVTGLLGLNLSLKTLSGGSQHFTADIWHLWGKKMFKLLRFSVKSHNLCFFIYSACIYKDKLFL